MCEPKKPGMANCSRAKMKINKAEEAMLPSMIGSVIRVMRRLKLAPEMAAASSKEGSKDRKVPIFNTKA